MEGYVEIVALLNFLVDLLLILGTNRLAGYPPGIKRAVLPAVLGGVHAGACLVPGFRFLGSGLWRGVVMCLMSWGAFGADRSGLRRGMLLALLMLAVNGAVVWAPCSWQRWQWGLFVSGDFKAGRGVASLFRLN